MQIRLRVSGCATNTNTSKLLVTTGGGAERMRMGDSVRPDLSALYASSDPLRSFKPVSNSGDLGRRSHQE